MRVLACLLKTLLLPLDKTRQVCWHRLPASHSFWMVQSNSSSPPGQSRSPLQTRLNPTQVSLEQENWSFPQWLAGQFCSSWPSGQSVSPSQTLFSLHFIKTKRHMHLKETVTHPRSRDARSVFASRRWASHLVRSASVGSPAGHRTAVTVFFINSWLTVLFAITSATIESDITSNSSSMVHYIEWHFPYKKREKQTKDFSVSVCTDCG